MVEDPINTSADEESVYSFVHEQLQYGMSETEVVDMLVENGIEHEPAAALVREVNILKKDASREMGKKNMWYGALWCVGGLMVTAVTYSAAAGGGHLRGNLGRRIIWWHPVPARCWPDVGRLSKTQTCDGSDTSSR